MNTIADVELSSAANWLHIRTIAEAKHAPITAVPARRKGAAAATTNAGPSHNRAVCGPAVQGSASRHELDQVNVAPYIDAATVHTR